MFLPWLNRFICLFSSPSLLGSEDCAAGVILVPHRAFLHLDARAREHRLLLALLLPHLFIARQLLLFE